jgi:hypothetical protein
VLPQREVFLKQNVRRYLQTHRSAKMMENQIIDTIAASINLWVGKVILIVEDVESNYQFLAATLSKSGAELLWARTGEEALELLKSERSINLVLMDIRLVNLDGYGVTRELKKLRPGLPVIAQTAYAMKGEQEKSKEAGCDAYLAKPIRPSELLKAVSRYI